MPTYNYTCQNCGETFTVRLPYAEEADARPECPVCGGADCARGLSDVNIAIGGHGDEKEPFRLTKEHVALAAGMSRTLLHDGHHPHDHAGGDGKS